MGVCVYVWMLSMSANMEKDTSCGNNQLLRKQEGSKHMVISVTKLNITLY